MKQIGIVAGVWMSALVLGAAGAAETNWVAGPQKDYAAKTVVFDQICGEVTVDPASGGPVKVQASGRADLMRQLKITLQGQALHIAAPNCHNPSLHGLKALFALIRSAGTRPTVNLKVHVIVPDGTPLAATDVLGNFHIGNTHGPLNFVSHSSGDIVTGDVSAADLRIDGSSDFRIGSVAGALKAELQGSGDLYAGHVAGGADCATHGSGDIHLKNVQGALQVRTSGSGDVRVGDVQGAVHVSTSGSGDIRIDAGTADPFVAHTSGSGDISFGGTAKHADTVHSGSGDIHIRNRG